MTGRLVTGVTVCVLVVLAIGCTLIAEALT